jgi:SPP1 gp7 family putative phage head morphogenesis protein
MPDQSRTALATQRSALLVKARRGLGIATRRHRVPRAQYPKLVEGDYARAIVDLVTASMSAVRQLIDALPRLLRSAQETRGIRADEDEARTARDAIERARLAVEQLANQTAIEGAAERAARQTSIHHRTQLSRQTKAALGVELVTMDARVPAMLKHFVAENVALIRSLAARPVDEIEKLVTRAFTEGLRYEDVAAEIHRRYEIAERHARLIARDQIGKLNAQITMARHREIGIQRFRWRTMRDGKVRRKHAVRDGKVYRYDDPHPQPGVEVCCRCYPEPVFDDLLSMLDAL